MTGIPHKLLWICQILITMQSTATVRLDTSLSNVEALYNTYKSKTNSEVTYYGTYPGGGACALDPLSPMARQQGWIRVAAGHADFQKSLGCGMCVEITGSGKGSGVSPVTGTIKAIVHDLCGGCKKGGFDLYINGDGRWEVTSRSIDCPTLQGPEGNIMFRFTGSNPWYIKLQARNIKIPVAGIEVLKGGKYSCLRRTSDNYFVGDGLGQVEFPMRVRVTSISGEQLEATLPSMKNDNNIPSNIQFGGISKGRGPSGIKCFGQGNKPPYPPGGMSPSEKGGVSPGSNPGVGSPGSTGSGNQGGGPSNKPPSSGAPNKGGNGDFCESREDGVHPDPDDCRGFILCDAGKTYRKKCAPGLLFNPEHLGCDLPERVKCRRKRRRRPGKAEKRGKLSFAGKPAVEIVIQKEKAQDTHRAASTEGIQAIRPSEELGGVSGKLEAGTAATPQGNKGVANTSKVKEDGHASESMISPEGQRPRLASIPIVTKENTSSTGTRSENRNQKFSSHSTGQGFSEKGGLESAISEVISLVGRKAGEKGGGQGTPPKGVHPTGAEGGRAPINVTTGAGAAGAQSGILTQLPYDKLSNTKVPHQGGAAHANTSASKGLGIAPASEQSGGLGTTAHAPEREKQGTAPTPNRVPLSIEVPGQRQGLNTAGSGGPSGQETHVPGQQAEKEAPASMNGRNAGLTGQEAANTTRPELTTTKVSGVDVVTSEEVKAMTSSKPAVSKGKEKSAPLVGITIKQTGQPDKYVLVNKRQKLRTKHQQPH